jgi:hypothetical protein
MGRDVYFTRNSGQERGWRVILQRGCLLEKMCIGEEMHLVLKARARSLGSRVFVD